MIKLTEHSHGAGCGCKIAPKLLDDILKMGKVAFPEDKKLLVGNSTKDDAAVYAIDDKQAIISTTDFFMPIVDDPFTFGRIAATNAISDIYAMGGKPIMAIAILGWPIATLSAEVAAQVVDGGRQACKDAGIILAGGHSIDSPEPIFGLAVNGIVAIDELKRNDEAQTGDLLFFTKKIGVGIYSTAQKQKKITPEHLQLSIDTMCVLNTIGMDLAKNKHVHAMTDVTGFGLAGHLLEICEGSDLYAEIYFDKIPLIDPSVEAYRKMGCIPGGGQRNFESYGHNISPVSDQQKQIICDPQTSGGLLVSISEEGVPALLKTAESFGLQLEPIGKLKSKADYRLQVI